MAIIVAKELALSEDISFGFGLSTQERGGTLFNASYLPYSATESVTAALDNRYTSSYTDSNFAAINGALDQKFLVQSGSVSNEAVNYGQLNLKADRNDVDDKAYKNGSISERFKVAPAIDGSEVYTKLQSDTELDLKESILDNDDKLALKAELSGSGTQVFNIADGSLLQEAVNVKQLTEGLDLKADTTYVDTQDDLKANKDNVLELDNNTVYTPLFDYNPSPKRYVDDSISTAFQLGVTGSFTVPSGETVTVVNGLIVGIV